MGHTFTVYKWTSIDCKDNISKFDFILLYEGEDKREAFKIMEEYKKKYDNMIKLEWR